MVKVSVIVPVYNVEDYLGKCLDSVINQTFEDIEIICIDDGSTDSSLEILKEYSNKDNRIKIVSQENTGAYESRNKGMEIANGEYLMFLDSDDWLELNCIDKLYDHAKSNDSEMVLFNSLEIFSDGTRRERIYPKDKNVDYSNFTFDYRYNKRLVMNNMFVVWSKFYKTSFLKDNDLKFVSQRLFEDVPFHIETMLKAKKVSYLPEILHNYNRLNVNSLQNFKADYNKRLAIFDIFDIVEDMLVKNGMYDEFKYEFFESKIRQININLNQTLDCFKEDYYKKMRDEFLKMRLDSNTLNKLPFNIYGTYIHVLNFKHYSDFNSFMMKIHN